MSDDTEHETPPSLRSAPLRVRFEIQNAPAGGWMVIDSTGDVLKCDSDAASLCYWLECQLATLDRKAAPEVAAPDGFPLPSIFAKAKALLTSRSEP